MIRSLRDTYRDAFSGLPRPVWLLSIAQLVNRSGTMVLPFLTLWLTEQRGFSTTDAGNALGLYGIGAMAGAFAGGELVDRVGARHVMLASLVLNGAGFLLLGSLEARAAILAMMFVQSFVGEALRPAASSALAQCAAPGGRVKAYALNRLAVNLGMTLGPTIGGFIAMHSYAALFVANAIAAFAAATTLWILFRGEPSAPAHAHASSDAPARSPWRDAPYLSYLGLMTLLAIVLFQLSSTYTLYLHKDLGYSEARVGLLLGTNTLVIVLLEMVIVHKLRGISALRLIGPGAFLLGAGFGLMPFGASFTWLVFTVLVWTCGEMLALPLVESIAAERADEKSRGRYMGMLTISFGFAFMVSPIVGTRVYERFGPDVLWYGCGVAGLALWFGFAALARALGGQAPSK